MKIERINGDGELIERYRLGSQYEIRVTPVPIYDMYHVGFYVGTRLCGQSYISEEQRARLAHDHELIDGVLASAMTNEDKEDDQ